MKLQTISTIIQWVLVAAILAGIYFFVIGKIHFTATMTGFEVILFALSIAFTFVEVAKILPCMKCTTGWVALLLALLFHTPMPWFYLFTGLFAGAVFSTIKMRWL